MGSESAIQNANDQPYRDREIAEYVKNFVEESRQNSARVTAEAIWLTNIAYVLGFDGVYFDSSTRTFRTVDRGTNYLKRNRTRVNKILPNLQNRTARLAKSPPKFECRPKSADQEDKDASRLALQILTMIWDKEQVLAKRIPLFMWMQQCGHAYLKVSWDDQAGEPMVDPMTNELSYEGDVRVEIVSAFECFPDPLAKTWHDVRKFCQAKVRPLDYFRTHYPEKGAAVKEEGAWLLSAQYEGRINALNKAGPQGGTTMQQLKNSAIELSYYEARSKQHPNGRLIIVANGIVLEDKELPCGEIPFAKFDDIIVGGKYNSESTVTHCRPLQDQYNRTIIKRHEWVNKLLNGKILAARGHNIHEEALNDRTEVVYHTPVPNAPPPGALSMPLIPQYAYMEEDKIDAMFAEVMGISEISKGQLPAAGIPAQGMQLLQEADDTRIGIVTESNEHSFARVGQLILKYVEKYYEMPRLLKVAGKSGEYEIKSFTGADINGNTDIIVIRGSTVPGSKALRRQELLNAYDRGLLGDPNDPMVRENVLSNLEYGDVAEVWKDHSLAMGQIKRDLDQIEQGIEPMVDEKDNHPLHIQEKNRYRISDKFLQLDPVRQKLLQENIEMHIQWVVKLTQPPQPDPQDLAVQDVKNEMQQSQDALAAGGPDAPGV